VVFLKVVEFSLLIIRYVVLLVGSQNHGGSIIDQPSQFECKSGIFWWFNLFAADMQTDLFTQKLDDITELIGFRVFHNQQVYVHFFWQSLQYLFQLITIKLFFDKISKFYHNQFNLSKRHRSGLLGLDLIIVKVDWLELFVERIGYHWGRYIIFLDPQDSLKYLLKKYSVLLHRYLQGSLQIIQEQKKHEHA
jgi:hypothetical protein